MLYFEKRYKKRECGECTCKRQAKFEKKITGKTCAILDFYLAKALKHKRTNT